MPFDGQLVVDTAHLQIASRHPRIRTAIWDVETNGLLDSLTRVHCLVIRDFERRVTYRFRRNDTEDTIDDGLDMLEQAEFTVGLNCVHFDIPAINKVYESINLQGKVRDALVMSRMVFSNQKEKDFRLYEKGKLPGKLIGSHTLESWGYRLGLHKGDYKETMEERARALGITDPAAIVDFVWGAWNSEMEDYCVNDVDVTTLLWDRILRAQWPEPATVLEHTIHDLMGQQERNGIHFNVEEAETLAADLEEQAHNLEQATIAHYGKWWMPEKKRIIRALWDDPDGINKSKTYEKARPEYGEDDSRAIWGEVVEIKKTLKFKDELRADRYAGALYCPVKCNEFNPNSRQQVIDRFATVYNWHPVDFTEKGQPEVSDDVLRKLVDVIPMARELAEVFYYNKRLGQLKTGANALLKKTGADGKIHAYVNVGGTVSGRASHVSPNLAQVPRVVAKKGLGVLKGRAGDHGWDFRNLFYVPDTHILTGVDLEGIELRCFGERLARYDGGAYLELVLSGDPHTYNQNLAGLPTRDMAKTFIYALLYGAGDIKLGSIVAPLADEDEQRAIGARLRERFLAGFPAFGKLLKEVRGYAKAGFIPGLDGRRLFVRSPHSALNTWLQSDAALIAKEWVCRTETYLLDRGLDHGWDADFTFLLWIHDEIQIASRNLGHIVADCALRAAKDAGLHFGYSCPISASPKHGCTWAETH
jgi:DNA polymerase I-like protein with 3'-5' exonuclease and polymerase domains